MIELSVSSQATCANCGALFVAPTYYMKKTCSRICASRLSKFEQGSSWTDQRVEQLKMLWADGLSASQIAKQLGITRNAVIGKVHRLKLPGRISPIPHTPRVPRRKGAQSEYNKLHAVLRRKVGAQEARRMVSEQIERDSRHIRTFTCDQDIPLAQRCQLLDFTRNTCRWPVGNPQDADFFFCGGASHGETYCAAHSRLAYNRDPRGWRGFDARQAEKLRKAEKQQASEVAA